MNILEMMSRSFIKPYEVNMVLYVNDQYKETGSKRFKTLREAFDQYHEAERLAKDYKSLLLAIDHEWVISIWDSKDKQILCRKTI